MIQNSILHIQNTYFQFLCKENVPYQIYLENNTFLCRAHLVYSNQKGSVAFFQRINPKFLQPFQLLQLQSKTQKAYVSYF